MNYMIDFTQEAKRKPFSFEDTAKTRREKSQKQEKRWAKKVGGKTQPASGAFWAAKGDVKEKTSGILESFLWENKQTSKNSYRLTIDTWNEIREKAFQRGNLPGMQIELHPPGVSPVRLVVLAEDDFLALRKEE
jgi:hypothetical protein